ncbi:PhoH family protein [Candidatus Woesearchaeota archaeon]|nr:PhoH family protein [Candidatus Woesearchaeota archaeon]
MVQTRYKVLDTNILLLDAESVFSDAFKPKSSDDITYLVIPPAVIEELDGFKHAEGALGYNSRHATQTLHELQRTSGNMLCEGIRIQLGYFVRTTNGYEEEISQHFSAAEREIARRVPQPGSNPKADHLILATAMAYKKAGKDVELITQDSNLSLLAGAFGIDADDWKAIRSVQKEGDFYKGYRDVEVDKAKYARLQASTPAKNDFDSRSFGIEDYKPNEYFRIWSTDGKIQAILARNDPFRKCLTVFALSDDPLSERDQKIHTVAGQKMVVEGISPRNYQQAFLLDALNDTRICNVNIFGKAGTGKTLLTLAAAYRSVKEEKIKELLITKPIVPIGNTMGYLPGTKDEKLEPWLRGFKDNMKLIAGGEIGLDDLIKSGVIEVQPLETVRGRSIQKGFSIVDEAQNLTPLEAKVMMTRMAGTSRIVLLGDPDQVDHPALNKRTNGILHVVQNMSDFRGSASIYLDIGERSELATYAAERL